jgi:hypothetical protein
VVFDAALLLVPLSMRTDLDLPATCVQVNVDDVRQCLDLFDMRAKKYFTSKTLAYDVFNLASLLFFFYHFK